MRDVEILRGSDRRREIGAHGRLRCPVFHVRCRARYVRWFALIRKANRYISIQTCTLDADVGIHDCNTMSCPSTA